MDIIREYVNTYVNGFAQLIVPGTEQANRAEISIVSGTLKVDAFKQMGDNSFTTVYSASLSAPQKTVIRVEHTTYIPVFSSMNYSDDKANCPGFDVGLILAEGMSADAKPVGGFITVRNYWE